MPERDRQARARILPTPGRPRFQSRGQVPSTLPERIEGLGLPIEPGNGWAIPSRAGRVEDFVVQPHKIEVFVEPLWVLLGRWHQIFLVAKMQSGLLQQLGYHRG